MNIVFTIKVERMVQQKVASGRYTTVSEVVRKALELMDERDQLENLRSFVVVGIEQADRGKWIEGSVEFAEVLEQAQQ